MRVFFDKKSFDRQRQQFATKDGEKNYVLVTANFTVLSQAKNGDLVHSFIQDAQLNLFFDQNGNLRSQVSSKISKKLSLLSKLDDSYIIVKKRFFKKRHYLIADSQNKFTFCDEFNSLAKYRLLSVETVLEIKRKKSVSNVISQSRAPSIPRIIHQTYWTSSVPDFLKENVEHLKNLNPSWIYRYWNDEEIIRFINEAYGWKVLQLYLSINPQYGAARADLFRYLCIFYYGGVYLDIKSTLSVKLDEIIKSEDECLLSYWNNEPGARYAGFGLHSELDFSPRGELQQWHVIAAPRHPFLKHVIENVLDNIANYRVDVNGYGKLGVLRTTGPIAYTKAIYPHISKHNCRFISAEDSGIEYKIFDDHHSYLGGRLHYSEQTASIVI